jgi:hypothetical protein
MNHQIDLNDIAQSPEVVIEPVLIHEEDLELVGGGSLVNFY